MTLEYAPMRIPEPPPDYSEIDRKSYDVWPNENSRNYFCLCQKCHVRRGTMLVGAVEVVCAGLHFVYAVQNYARGGAVAPSSVEVTLSFVFICVVLLMIYGVYKQRRLMLIPHLAWSIIFIILVLILGIFVVIAWIIGGVAASILVTNSHQIEDKILKNGGTGTTPGTEDFDDPYPPTAGNKSRKDNGQEDEIMDYYFDPPDAAKSVDGKQLLLLIVILLLVVFIITVAFEIWFFTIILACYRYLRDKELYFKRIGGINCTDSDLPVKTFDNIPLKDIV